MSDKDKLNQAVKAIVEKANRILEDAKILFSESRFESVSSRAYYSVFHVMQAAKRGQKMIIQTEKQELLCLI